MDHSALPADDYLAKVYWMFVCGFIGVAGLVHLACVLECRLRLQKASCNKTDPARPQDAVSCYLATATAIIREAIYFSPRLLAAPGGQSGKRWRSKVLKAVPQLAFAPPIGRLLLVSTNLALLLGLVFYGFSAQNKREWEMIAVRAGWLTLSQLPLVLLLAGKVNFIGFVTGTSYERLNWIHRNVARCMLITAAIHIAYFLRSWARYHYIQRKFIIDIHSRNGLGAFCVLLWLVISSAAPIRGWRYEIFYIQHMISAIGFLVIVWVHTPENAHAYVWITVALWALDRVVRFGFWLYINIRIFHPNTSNSGLFSCQALIHPLADKATRITIPNPPFTWRPGQHVFFLCHSVVPLQSHPFTITSLPSDGYLELVVRARSGGSGRLYHHACGSLPPTVDKPKTVFLDGPYGTTRPLEQFDSVILLAGGTGASFIVPLLRDLLRLNSVRKPCVVKRIRVVWVVKSRGQVQWFQQSLASIADTWQRLHNLVLEPSIYVTCDPELASQNSATASSECRDDFDDNSTNGVAPRPGAIKKVLVVDRDGCGPNDACCCTDIAGDENVTEQTQEPCRCHPEGEDSAIEGGVKPSQSYSSKPWVSSIQQPLRVPDIFKLATGRPPIRNIVERELELARGESAVVVCGPHGLADCARRAVVSLSDERGVHKGTGAQGVRFPSYSSPS